jgi:hypothetical protein
VEDLERTVSEVAGIELADLDRGSPKADCS